MASSFSVADDLLIRILLSLCDQMTAVGEYCIALGETLMFLIELCS